MERRDRRPWIMAKAGRGCFQIVPGHQLGHYNAVQRLLYIGVIIAICMAILTGLSIWKPVQLGWLTGLFGGYPVARRIHFTMMVLILAFLVVHLALVALFPRTLISMLAPIPSKPDNASREGAR